MNKCNEKYNEIERDPIFIMSLSSKELFHSNFWAWLFERNIEYAKIFFNDINPTKDKIEVKREERKRDITIWVNKNKCYVIENKFKSLPDKEQLIKYQNKIKNNGNTEFKGIITGIVKPSFMDDIKEWKFISYKKIGEKIYEFACKEEKNDFEKKLIIKYGKMIIALFECLSQELNKNNKLILENDSLKKIRMEDIYCKLVIEKFSNYVNEKNIIRKYCVKGYELRVRPYYIKNPGLDIRYVKINKEENNIDVIGIQLEKNQYRWIIQKNCAMQKYGEEMDNIFEKFKKLEWFSEYNGLKKINHNQKNYDTYMCSLKNDKPYRIYTKNDNNDKYVFMYQYLSLEGKVCEYEVLLGMIESDIKKANEIIKKVEKCEKTL